MKKRILITLFAALLFSFSISAQILKGHVYDATTNEPLAGASVTYKLKDTQGVVTDINGAYEVHLPAGGVDLVFSYVGYEDVPMPIVISKGDIMQKDVYMKESTNLLEDVVVSAGRFEQKLSDVLCALLDEIDSAAENWKTPSMGWSAPGTLPPKPALSGTKFFPPWKSSARPAIRRRQWCREKIGPSPPTEICFSGCGRN